MHEIEIEVREEFNLYKKLLDEFGKEKKETPIPNPYGASSLRQWDNGICLVRKVEYDFERKIYVMKDKVSLPNKPEFKRVFEELRGMK